MNTTTIWQTATSGNSGATLKMQSAGDLVVALGSTHLWDSGTGGAQSAHLVLESNGDLEILLPNGTLVWDSGTGMAALALGPLMAAKAAHSAAGKELDAATAALVDALVPRAGRAGILSPARRGPDVPRTSK
jgi:hypothetical protein